MVRIALNPHISALSAANTRTAAALEWYLKALPSQGIEVKLIQASPAGDAHLTLVSNIDHPRPPRNYGNNDPLIATDPSGDLARAILTFLPQDTIVAAQEEKLNNWQAGLKPHTSVNLFAPGPSGRLKEATTIDLNIITAGGLISQALQDNTNVDAVVITDSVSLLGEDSFPAALRRDIIALQTQSNCAFFTTLPNAVCLLPYWPSHLAHLLIGVPERVHPTYPDMLIAKPTGNVLTTLLLPLATRLSKRVNLYGFEGALGVGDLSHSTGHSHKFEVLKRHFGAGYLFADEYQASFRQDVNKHISAYQEQGITFEAPGWQAAPVGGASKSSRFNPYEISLFADTHPLLCAAASAAVSLVFIGLGMRFMSTEHVLIAAIAVLTFVFVFGFLHLRSRGKRLADLAERRATAKAERAFDAVADRVRDLESKNR